MASTPGLAQKYMDEGRMPNFKKLAEEGHFSPLATSCPSISPVAWSSYATGVDASRHNIYDFLTRDPCSYLPVLSSSEVGTQPRDIKPGLRQDPLRFEGLLPIPPEESALLEDPRSEQRLVVDHSGPDYLSASEVQERHTALRHVRS